jgi:hypothetical protein
VPKQVSSPNYETERLGSLNVGYVNRLSLIKGVIHTFNTC